MPKTDNDKGYTIIRNAYPPKPPKHQHNLPGMSEVDGYGAMVRCECGAVFTLKRVHAHPDWFRTWPWYPEHPDFGRRASTALGIICTVAVILCWFWYPVIFP